MNTLLYSIVDNPVTFCAIGFIAYRVVPVIHILLVIAAISILYKAINSEGVMEK